MSALTLYDSRWLYTLVDNAVLSSQYAMDDRRRALRLLTDGSNPAAVDEIADPCHCAQPSDQLDHVHQRGVEGLCLDEAASHAQVRDAGGDDPGEAVPA
jgi:hypothetical protein